MVQEIMSHSGDILKFSGDAFLALWKSTSVSSMSDVVHAAIDCALGIQRSHGQYVTEVGITLRGKTIKTQNLEHLLQSNKNKTLTTGV